MSTTAVALRATPQAFRRVMPSIIGRLRAIWENLPKGVKTSVVSAAGAAIGVAVSPGSEDLRPVLAEASTRDIASNVDMLGAMLSKLRKEDADGLLAGLRDLPESQAVSVAIEAARARASATAGTGDGDIAADPAAQYYDQMLARIAILRRALTALGTTNPEDLRAIRDAMFMDEQEFAAALSRL